MDFQLLVHIVEELSALITTARVERVYQTPEGALVLIVDRDRKKFTLLISPDRSLPRLHLVTAKPPAGEAPHAFAMYLRSHLPGTRITHIALLNQDRIVEIRFSKPAQGYCLVAHLFGPSANLIITDASSTILTVHHPVPPVDGSSRPLLPGLLYRPPEKKPRRGGNEDAVSSVSTEEIRSPNRAAEQYYEVLLEERREQALRAELSAVLKRAAAKAERLRDALTRDLGSAEHAEEYRRAGDMVLANLHTLKTGMERVELTGYDGTTAEVRLDPKRSPARNAERYFKLYKKAKAGREIILDRLRETENEAAWMRSYLSRLDAVSGIVDLTEMRSDLVSRGYLRERNRKGSSDHPVSAGPPFKKVYYQEWEILIGKSAAGNDYLTTKLARPDDLWLHAEGLPGSHVLVRNPRNMDIPPAVLRKAASLAAFYSKGKASGKVSVTYTRAGLVRKPRGAKPGLVSLSERRSLMVKPEDA